MHKATSTILLALLLVGFMACQENASQALDPEALSFDTTDASKLFFKNVRQNSYRKEELKEAKLEVYRHRDWKDTESPARPLLVPAIVINWRYDQAYLLLENNSYWPLEQDPLPIYWQQSTLDGNVVEEGQMDFTFGSKKNLLQQAAVLYQHIVAGHQLFIGDDKQPFLNEGADREAFRVTLVDYLRLTEAL